ncbi:hypothetical protein EPN15_00525 [Patescibacteria group bacterium]|nr:MAG: hypothetical protein EPN15_00525 [Patescibacteria group bacterium]
MIREDRKEWVKNIIGSFVCAIILGVTFFAIAELIFSEFRQISDTNLSLIIAGAIGCVASVFGFIIYRASENVELNLE